MRIGVPKEIKPGEWRVALIPAAAAALVRAGHRVLIQAGAGAGSGYADADYRAAGAEIVPTAEALYGEAEMVLKVKEPLPPEYERLRRDHLLFSFLHLPANPPLARTLCDRGLTAVAFESLEENGELPLLAPMSDIAGRLAAQIGATLLHRHHGGSGTLLGGTGAAEPGRVVILGAGAAGRSAAALAAAFGSQVTVFGRQRERLARVQALGPNVSAHPAERARIAAAVREADLVIGALRVPEGVAPKLVSVEDVRAMRPGSVIIDICIDQGGCVETIRPTRYDEPTYIEHGVVHFAVPNMPGAVPRTASQALAEALAPYAQRLARTGAGRVQEDEALARAVNVAGGRIVHAGVAEACRT